MPTLPTPADPTRRFSSRVDYYVRSRPHYPPQVLQVLTRDCALAPTSIVADIGFGTGLLTRLFLSHGNTVYGVEPNAEMREAGEHLLRDFPNFRSIVGTAEATGLPAASVDLIVAGQAFHWFDPHAARQEFQRILRPGGFVALIWNDRRLEADDFSRGYQDLILRHAIDHEKVKQLTQSAMSVAVTDAFFGPAGHTLARCPNDQRLDLAGLTDRLASSSYMPLPDDPRFEPLERDLRRLFDTHQSANHVTLHYDTEIYFGRFS